MAPASVFKAGNTAVITGGASGIGLALAQRCLKAGMRVLVTDSDEASLAALPTADDGNKLIKTRADVTSEADWAEVRAQVDSALGGKVNLLALNAGVGPPSAWDNAASFRAVLDVNLFGVINGITTLLPAVRRAAAEDAAGGGEAAVVITGSKQGITNPPGNPAYNASKAAVRTLAEHLDYDLRDTPVKVHLLVPGWTYTGLSGNKAGAGKTKPDGAWWPDQVVDFLQAKMAEGSFYVICPDNDVSEETDRKRMRWGLGDLLEGRPPLTRWRGEWKAQAQEWMDKQ